MAYEYDKSQMYGAYDYGGEMSVEKLYQIFLSSIFGTNDIEDGAITNVKIEDLAIDYAKIAHASIGEVHIREAAINNAMIQNLAVSRAKIQDAAINTAKIEDLSVTGAKIGNAAITNAKIEDAAITSAKIEYAAIDHTHIKDGEITNAKIALAAIKTANIEDAAITGAKIEQAAIQGAHIELAVIDRSHIAEGEILNAHIANAAIDNAKIKDAAIDTAKIAVGAITTGLIEDAAIGTTQIADASITDAKIVELTANKITAGTLNTSLISIAGLDSKLAISGNRLQVFDNQTVPVERVSIGDVNNDGTVYGFRLRSADGETTLIDTDGVYSEGITDGAITNPKIGNEEIHNHHLHFNTITGDKLVVDSITGREIAAESITANHMVANTITAASGVIADAAIGTAQIADAAITDAKIASLDASKIKTGTLDAGRIKIGYETLFEDGYDPTAIEVGGSNLINNGNFSVTPFNYGWFTWGTGGTPSGFPIGEENGQKYAILKATNHRLMSANSNTAVSFFEPGNKYTLSVYAKAINGYSTANIQMVIVNADGQPFWSASSEIITVTNKWEQYSFTALVPENIGNVRVEIYKRTNSNDLGMNRVQLEKGSVASDWKYSMYEQMLWAIPGTTEIDGGRIRTNSIEADRIKATTLSAISADIGEIDAGTIRGVDIYGSKFETTNVDEGSTVTIEKGTLRSTDIASTNVKELMISAGSIYLNTYQHYGAGDYGHYRLAMTNTAFRLEAGEKYQYVNAMQRGLNTDIITNYFNYSTGRIRATTTVSQWLTGSYGSDEKFSYNFIFDTKKPIRFNQGITGRGDNDEDILPVQTPAGILLGETNNDKVELQGSPRGVEVWTPHGFAEMGARNASYFHFSTNRPGFYFYQFINAAEVISRGQVTLPNNGTIRTPTGYIVVRSEGADLVYLQGSGARVTAPSAGTTYRPIAASAFNVNSVVTSKQDIVEWDKSILDMYRNDITVYNYRLKDEVEREIYRDRQGLVIGKGYNTPAELVDGDGVEQYLMNTWNMKAIQELIELVDTLYDRIEVLENK